MRLTLLAAGLLLGGCATLPPATDGLEPSARYARLAATTHWRMNGRLAIDTGERAFQARFRWRQEADALTLTVRGPLGAGSFEISGTDDSLTVLSGGDRRVLDDPETQLSAAYGWWLPVTSLKYWLLGLADERFPADRRSGEAGELERLEQRFWRLDYSVYQVAAGVLIPRSVRMAHAPLTLELSIDGWEPLVRPETP